MSDGDIQRRRLELCGASRCFSVANTCFTVEFPAVVRSETKNREHARVDSCLCAPADFRTRPRSLAWRLVLEARVAFAQGVGPRGLHADANRTRRAPAPDERGYRIGYTHPGRTWSTRV